MDIFLTVIFLIMLSIFMTLSILRSLNIISTDFVICTMSITLINAIFITPNSVTPIVKIIITFICFSVYFLTLRCLFNSKNNTLYIASLPNMIGKRLIACETITNFSEGMANLNEQKWRCITIDGSVVIFGETVEVVEQDASLLKVKRLLK